MDSVDTVNIEETNLKRIFLYDGWRQEVWIEGIGCIYGLLHSGFHTSEDDSYLVCVFQDGENIYHDPFFNTCFIEATNVQVPQKLANINVFPTLVQRSLTVSSEQYPVVVRVTDLLGRTYIKQVIREETTFSCSAFPPGFYICTIFDTHGQHLLSKKIIKQ